MGSRLDHARRKRREPYDTTTLRRFVSQVFWELRVAELRQAGTLEDHPDEMRAALKFTADSGMLLEGFPNLNERAAELREHLEALQPLLGHAIGCALPVGRCRRYMKEHPEGDDG